MSEITTSEALSVYMPDIAAGQGVAPGRTPVKTELRRMVLGSVVSPHTPRRYAKTLDDLFAHSAGRPLTRSLVMEYRATMAALSSSTVNVRLSANRKMVCEARKNGLRGAEEAANLTGVPNLSQTGPVWETG